MRLEDANNEVVVVVDAVATKILLLLFVADRLIKVLFAVFVVCRLNSEDE